jgi:hypothetical protein
MRPRGGQRDRFDPFAARAQQGVHLVCRRQTVLRNADQFAVQAQLFFGNEIGRLVIVLGELFHRPQVRVLRLGGQAMQLHVLDHALP